MGKHVENKIEKQNLKKCRKAQLLEDIWEKLLEELAFRLTLEKKGKSYLILPTTQ